jgi:hypothetical protein
MASKLSKKQIETLLANMPKPKQAVNVVDNTSKAKPRPEENPASKEAYKMFLGQLQRKQESQKRFINDAGPQPVYKNVGEKVRADLERESRQRDLMASIPNEKFNTWVENVGMPVADAAMIAEAGFSIPKLLKTLGPKLNKETVNAIAKKTNKSSAIGDFLSDKEKEMYEFFKKEERFTNLPKTKNQEILSVYDNFLKRINSDEGKKRMKSLGITKSDLLKDIKFIEDPTDYGYYRGQKNTVAIHPDLELKPTTTRHEIEHAVQNAALESSIDLPFKVQLKQMFTDPTGAKWRNNRSGLTEIDNILSNLELKKTPNLERKWQSKNIDNNELNVSDFKEALKNKQNATDYFATGSEGKEKSPFLSEVQQYMMDNNIIPKDKYVEVTPEMVKNTFIDAQFDNEKGGKSLRLFNIIKANDNNYNLISKGLNKMLGLGSSAVLGKKLLSEKTVQTLKKKKNG